MKKITTLIIAAITLINISFAQNTTGKIILTKGQKLMASGTSSGKSNMEMMGQSMEIENEVTATSTIVVKDISATGYILTVTPDKMKIKTKGGMGAGMDFDTDKKEDMDSDIGKKMKESFQPKDMEITFNGKLIEKKDSITSDDDMTKAMQSMQSIISGADPNILSTVFLVVPAGKNPGDIWADSSNIDGIKINNTYTLKKINGNEATVIVNTVSTANKTVEAQGAELIISMDSKITSENIVDLKTGIVKQKNTSIEGSGNMSVAGQEMPITTKLTAVTTVKNM